MLLYAIQYPDEADYPIFFRFPPSKPSRKMENISFVVNTNGIFVLCPCFPKCTNIS